MAANIRGTYFQILKKDEHMHDMCNLKVLESNQNLVSRVFAVTEPPLARTPTGSSSKSVNRVGRWRAADTSLLLAIVGRLLICYLWVPVREVFFS
jgi:hypothetical protein